MILANLNYSTPNYSKDIAPVTPAYFGNFVPIEFLHLQGGKKKEKKSLFNILMHDRTKNIYDMESNVKVTYKNIDLDFKEASIISPELAENSVAVPCEDISKTTDVTTSVFVFSQKQNLFPINPIATDNSEPIYSFPSENLVSEYKTSTQMNTDNSDLREKCELSNQPFSELREHALSENSVFEDLALSENSVINKDLTDNLALNDSTSSKTSKLIYSAQKESLIIQEKSLLTDTFHSEKSVANNLTSTQSHNSDLAEDFVLSDLALCESSKLMRHEQTETLVPNMLKELNNLAFSLSYDAELMNGAHKKTSSADSSVSDNSTLSKSSRNQLSRSCRLANQKQEGISATDSTSNKKSPQKRTKNSKNYTGNPTSTEKKLIYKCDVCNKTFSQKIILSRHHFTHTGEKPHTCDVCDRKFSRKGHLVEHYRTHTGERPHMCQICGRTFTQKRYLNAHAFTHSSEKPWECDVCSKRFNQKQSLATHYVMHTGEKPYVCDICEKCFSRRGDLSKHRFIHNNDKSFICEVCNKAFAHKRSLTKHCIMHTKELDFLMSMV